MIINLCLWLALFINTLMLIRCGSVNKYALEDSVAYNTIKKTTKYLTE